MNSSPAPTLPGAMSTPPPALRGPVLVAALYHTGQYDPPLADSVAPMATRAPATVVDSTLRTGVAHG